MSTILKSYNPFLPFRTSVKTASYTIPTGFRASAIFYFTSNRKFTSGSIVANSITVNGVEVLRESVFILDSTSVSFSGITGEFEGNCNATLSSAGGSQAMPNASRITIGVQNSLSGGAFSGVLDNATQNKSVEIFLKAGDVINATGGSWMAILTEYVE